MRKLIQGTALLAVIVLVACEEAAAPKPVSPPPESTKLYREIGSDELLERWKVLPGGAVAESVNLQGRRLAAATDGFGNLPDTFVFSDAREYGSCVVFTVTVNHRDSDGTTWKEIVHIIDCPGGRTEGNAVDGLFHVAHLCEAKHEAGYYTMHIIRAGDFTPATHELPQEEWWGVTMVYATIAAHPSGSRHSGSFQWITHIELRSGERVPVNWALHGSGNRAAVNTAGFDALDSAEELHFGIDHSTGMVEIGDNDGAAYNDYLQRCASLPPK